RPLRAVLRALRQLQPAGPDAPPLHRAERLQSEHGPPAPFASRAGTAPAAAGGADAVRPARAPHRLAPGVGARLRPPVKESRPLDRYELLPLIRDLCRFSPRVVS